jgi:aspartate carbamoyltransferase catalytic subunit
MSDDFRDTLKTLQDHHITSSQSFSRKDLEYILAITSEMESSIKFKSNAQLLDGYILATLFFEPSTRTRLSFESAMLRLGGKVITVEQAESCSAEKGETLEDTGRVVSQYADIIVTRHPESGASERIASKSAVPVINAGDGPNEHPTQALLDLYTIFSEKKGLDNLKIGFLGDLKFGRTVHSLVKLLRFYKTQFTFISHPSIAIPEKIKELLKETGCTIKETENLEEAILYLDVLYVTRIQKERFTENENYEDIKNKYQLTQTILNNSKSDLTLLHPLPRVNEVSPEIDDDPKARYFKQAENGVYLRMALLATVLGKAPN